MATLSTLVPQYHVLTSGAGSAMTWTNVLTLSTANCSTVNASTLGANALTLNSTLSVSTLTSRNVNVSTIVGSSISSNTLTLSLVNTSTQNTQIYQVATTNPTTSYTAIQASHVSTGTTNNALVLNPSGGNVGVGTTGPGAPLQVTANSSGQPYGIMYVNANNTLSTTVNSYDILQQWNETPGGNNSMVNLLWNRTSAGSTWATASQRLQARTDADWQGFIEFNGTNNNYGVTIGAGASASNPNSVPSVMTIKNGGNVGIGTTAPGTTLHVHSSGASTSSGILSNRYYLSAPGDNMDTPSTTDDLWGPWYGMGYSPLGYPCLAGYSGVQLISNNGNVTLSSNGNVGIGTTAPQAPLHIRTDNPVHLSSEAPGTGPNYVTFKSNGTVYGYIGLDNSAGAGLFGSGSPFGMCIGSNTASNVCIGAGNGIRFVAEHTGIIYFPSYTTNGTLSVINSTGRLSSSSDRRIKENIVYQTDTQQGLASVLNLKPATFNMIGSSGTYLGFIAQDVEQDIPLAVDGKKYEWQWETTEDNKPKFDANGDIVYKLDADGNKIVRPRGVSDRAIIATQTLAIQELASRATSQATLVQELAKKLTAAEEQLAAKSAALDALIAWAQTMGYTA